MRVTYSAALWWMPTTKEYGPVEGYGDFEHHDRLASLLGLHFTGSRDDAQSQADTEDIENVNAQALQLYRSPVGYDALPYPLGGTGFIFTLDVELFF